jgi:hypothetical protein
MSLGSPGPLSRLDVAEAHWDKIAKLTSPVSEPQS